MKKKNRYEWILWTILVLGLFYGTYYFYYEGFKEGFKRGFFKHPKPCASFQVQ